jgi:hypothetical protein
MIRVTRVHPPSPHAEPIEEHHSVTDLFAEGVDRLEVVGGENLRFVFCGGNTSTGSGAALARTSR